jgi:formylglycine-generating enzyme required for sulfatase activity
MKKIFLISISVLVASLSINAQVLDHWTAVAQKDPFGDPTGEVQLVYATSSGTFSNTATSNHPMYLAAIIITFQRNDDSKTDIKISLLEYNANSTLNTDYIYSIKFTAYPEKTTITTIAYETNGATIVLNRIRDWVNIISFLKEAGQKFTVDVSAVASYNFLIKEPLTNELLKKIGYSEEEIAAEVAAKEAERKIRAENYKKAAAERKAAAIAAVETSMVHVAGGTFEMGCAFCEDDEKPVHKVTVDDFYIGKTEVTRALWRGVMNGETGDNTPVTGVSWNDVQKFIQKLNATTGKQYRLPTEAEWEFAARGGNKSRGYTYSGSNNPNDVAWYKANSVEKTHPVGTKSPNELGIYDMSGNVWEWCNDWYGDYSNDSQINPKGVSTGRGRVLRGGSWSRDASCVRVSYRSDNIPDGKSNNCGFRLALSSEYSDE